MPTIILWRCPGAHFKVHLFRAARTLIIPAVISKIIKYWLAHHSTLCRVMILPEDLEQFLVADGFCVKDHAHDFRVAGSPFEEATQGEERILILRTHPEEWTSAPLTN